MSESLHHPEATYGEHRRHLQVVRPAPSPPTRNS